MMHVGPRMSRVRELGPSLSDEQFAAVLASFPSTTDINIVVDAILAANERVAADAAQPPQQPQITAVPPVAVVVEAPRPLPAAATMRTTLLWDYDNVRPSFMNTSVRTFHERLLDALRERDVAVDDEIAFIVGSKNYGPTFFHDMELLHITVVACSGAAEAADRKLSLEIKKREAELLRTAPQRHERFVIVSSDKDFVPDVKRLTDAGHQVWVVHDANTGSDHEAVLRLYSSGTLHVSEFFVPDTPSYKVAGRLVERRRLISNEATAYLAAHPATQGMWCQNTRPHDPVTCRYVHSATNGGCDGCHSRTVNVDQRAVAISQLQPNSALGYLLNCPGACARRCIRAEAHDASKCSYVHFRAA